MAYKDKVKEAAYKKAWQLANREKLSAYNRARYAADKEAVKARVRAYAAEHIVDISASGYPGCA